MNLQPRSFYSKIKLKRFCLNLCGQRVTGDQDESLVERFG
jgi:hypothetical protein